MWRHLGKFWEDLELQGMNNGWRASCMILHTYGLGDAVMASSHLLKLQAHCQTNHVDFQVVVKDPVALIFLNEIGVSCVGASTFSFLLGLIKRRLSGLQVICGRTAGGVVWKDYSLRAVLKAVGISYFYASGDTVSDSSSVTYRSELNAEIVGDITRKMKFAQSGQDDDVFGSNVGDADGSSSRCVKMYFGTKSIECISDCYEPNNLYFHFGSGDSLSKELDKHIIRATVKEYKAKYGGAEFHVIVGPRDGAIISYSDLGVNIIGGEQMKTIPELLEMVSVDDLVVCNDTGIGHLLGSAGASVDLVVNKGQRALLHQVLPSTIRNIFLV